MKNRLFIQKWENKHKLIYLFQQNEYELINKQTMNLQSSSRRDFIKTSTLAAAGASLGLTGCTGIIKNADSQQDRREQLYDLLCDLPPRDRKIGAEVVSVEHKDGFILDKLSLDLNGQQQVPAWFALPENVKGRIPAVLFSHSHGGYYKLGKNELIQGNTYMPETPYAEALTQMGFCVLSIDHWVFGERSGRTELDFFKESLWRGQCMWGMMVYDSLRAMDYLCQRPEVDASRIGAIGMSMGSTMTWWVAALDTRVKVCVDICCLTDFDALIADNGLSRHGIFYYVPALLKYFSTADINVLIAPRAHLAIAGSLDKLTPLDGLYRIDKALKAAYEKLGAADKWKLNIYDIGHFETPEMRKDLLDFLKREL
jgi:acetyl esterase/lipase